MENILEIIKSKYECEMCHKVHEEEVWAENCELKHQEENDKHFKMYEDQQEKLKLEQAASHPEQVKLNGN